MVSYSKVRKYIDSVIATNHPDMRKWNDVFNIENIPSSLIDNGYHVNYSAQSISRQQRTIETNLTATINFFFKGYNSPTEKMDLSMDKVLTISRDLSSLESIGNFRVTDDYPIQYCNPTSQVANPLDTNDNLIIITLELELLVISTIC